jgi:hypothetical protein
MNDKTGEIRNLTNQEMTTLNSMSGTEKNGIWHDVSNMTGSNV